MKNKILILGILFVIMENSKAQDAKGYKAMPTAFLNKITEQKLSEITADYQLKDNKAYVTIFKDGSVILFPAAGLGEGILFDSVDVFNEMVKTGIYPVKGDSSFWEGEKERIVKLKESMPYYCDKLSKELDFIVELKDQPEYLKKLSEVITKKYKKKKLDEPIYYYVALYVGELIRQRENAEYKLNPKYTLNLYYIPELIKGDEFCIYDWFVISYLERTSKFGDEFDIETSIQKINKFYPGASLRYRED